MPKKGGNCIKEGNPFHTMNPLLMRPCQERFINENMDLRNVYFVIGTSYAGKSTLVKRLAEKHHGIALEENYHDEKLPELDSREFPNLTYTRDLQDWHEFIRRTPEETVCLAEG